MTSPCSTSKLLLHIITTDIVLLFFPHFSNRLSFMYISSTGFPVVLLIYGTPGLKWQRLNRKCVNFTEISHRTNMPYQFPLGYVLYLRFKPRISPGTKCVFHVSDIHQTVPVTWWRPKYVFENCVLFMTWNNPLTKTYGPVFFSIVPSLSYVSPPF